MQPIQLVEYKIRLSTGEIIQVAELEPFGVPPDLLIAAESILQRCSRMPRSVIEEAKLGHTKKFEALMLTEPVGALIKFESPICRMIRNCAMADQTTCTTRNVKMTTGKFPICWEYECSDSVPESLCQDVQAIAFAVVHAWRNGQWVIFVHGL